MVKNEENNFELKDENSDEVINEVEPEKIDQNYRVNPNLRGKEKKELHEVLNEYAQCFANCFKEIGSTNRINMTIELTSREPILCRPYRLPYAQRKIVTETINELLDAGIVRESRSNYASPVVLVRKRDGTERMCVDYRRLNAVTKRECVLVRKRDGTERMCVDYRRLNAVTKRECVPMMNIDANNK
ncbi:hypothetical protein QE152_g24735 [Popillia japonica]|uniref:Uncharacterized protein n=1 Tax=Popillia japonica TaxID=7064 RepID=A0AAW1K679_POPJA